MHHPRCTSKSTAKRFHDSKLSFLVESRGAMPPSGQVVVGENNRPAAIRSVGPPVVDLQNPVSGNSDLVKVCGSWLSATVAARGSRAQRIHRNLLERTALLVRYFSRSTDLPPRTAIHPDCGAWVRVRHCGLALVGTASGHGPSQRCGQ